MMEWTHASFMVLHLQIIVLNLGFKSTFNPGCVLRPCQYHSREIDLRQLGVRKEEAKAGLMRDCLMRKIEHQFEPSSLPCHLTGTTINRLPIYPPADCPNFTGWLSCAQNQLSSESAQLSLAQNSAQRSALSLESAQW